MGYFWHKVEVSMVELGFKDKRGQRKSSKEASNESSAQTAIC